MHANSTSRPGWMKPALAGLLAVAILAGLAGAVLGNDEPKPTCPKVEAAAADADHELLLLVDRSGSADNNQRRAQQRSDIRWAVGQGVDKGVERFSVAYFDGSTASMRWNACLDKVSLVPEGNNSINRKANTPALIDDVVDEIVQHIGEAGGSGTDVFGAVAEAASVADQGSKDVQIVALTDGVGTAGCARVDHIDQRSQQTIDADVARCTEQLGGKLNGTAVSLIGVGRTSDELSSESVDWLIELNRQSCKATGADRCMVATFHGGHL